MEHSRSRLVRRRSIRRRSSVSAGLAAAAVRGVAFLVLVAIGVAAVRLAYDRAHSYSSSSGSQSPAKSLNFFSEDISIFGIRQRNQRVVYPYSVVPGGVRSGDELRQIAEHDSLVAQHYSGFDYAHAHVVEVDRPRLVYVSYRRGGQIHWTSKQAMLRAGEKLLTDGKITARTRCGNQVSVMPHIDIVPNEPTMAELERPDAMASGSEQVFPQAATNLRLDPMIPIGPPYASFPQLGGFMPLPLGGAPGVPVTGGCPQSKKKGATGTSKNSKDCGNTPPPPPVPEPGTVVLFLSGAAAIYAELRRRRA